MSNNEDCFLDKNTSSLALTDRGGHTYELRIADTRALSTWKLSELKNKFCEKVDSCKAFVG